MLASNILPYNVEAYQSFYSEEFINSFTHSSLATGEIDPLQAKEMVVTLNEEASEVMPSISFNTAMLTGSQLDGGACSTIAFRVAKQALTLLKNLRENKLLNASSKERSFTVQFSRFLRHLDVMTTSTKSLDKTVQKIIRTEQYALNTITVNRDIIRTGNAVAEKVTAMASCYSLKVIESSQELRVKENDQLEVQLSEQMRNLKEGVYFLRIIQEEKRNHKLEVKGHSIVYIKTGNAEYYFDPQLGSYTLFSEAAKTNLIYNALLSANQKFGVDVLSFHRLEENNQVKADFFDVPHLKLKGVIYSPSPLAVDFPAVIFSPGLGRSIDDYKAIAEGLSIRGFTVMCVDHPGTGVGTPKLEESAIISRGRQNGEHIEKLVELIRESHFLKISSKVQIAVLGHSLGGSASIEACRKTSEIKAAINLDGRIIDSTQVSQPVLQIVAKRVKEDRTQYNAALEKLASLTCLEVQAEHRDFSSPHPFFVTKTVNQCARFLNQHLTKGI